MKIRDITLNIILSLAFVNASLAQSQMKSDAGEFHTKVTMLYSFEPHTLSSEQIESKSGQLDLFWKEVKSSPEKHLPLLRNELSSKNNSAYFYYDGSKLLLSISKEKQDQALALKSIPKADLKSIQHTDYLRTVHWFAINGFNTTDAALRILDYPDFKAFIVQHALTLGQDYSLIYMLFPMPDSKFVGALSSRLSNEENIQSQKSILLALWYAMNPDARATITKFIADNSKPQESRDYAKKLSERKASIVSGLTLSGVDKLKKERQEVMNRLNDEALYEFDNITKIILSKQ